MHKQDKSLQKGAFLIKRPNSGKKRIWQIELLVRNAAKLCYVEQLVPLPDIIPNPSGRKKRSQFEIALSRFLQAIFLYTDLQTLRVGDPRPKWGFRDASLQWLADIAGIHVSVAKRVYSALCDAGYMQASKQVRKFKDGVYKCYVTVKSVSTSLLNDLGLTSELYEQYLKEKRKEQDSKLIGKGVAFAKKLFNKIAKKTKSKAKKDKQKAYIEQRIIQAATSFEDYKALKAALEKPPPD